MFEKPLFAATTNIARNLVLPEVFVFFVCPRERKVCRVVLSLIPDTSLRRPKCNACTRKEVRVEKRSGEGCEILFFFGVCIAHACHEAGTSVFGRNHFDWTKAFVDFLSGGVH